MGYNLEKGLLRFVTCGSVDDGKSTLIGHMLYDAKLIYADQAQTLELESMTKSGGEGGVDYSLLLDGLEAEREQGITIDVAYRFFTTSVRSFIVADCPGHEEYTRNMAVGASTSELAVILVDASRGLQPQTYRHVRICALMGIRHFVFAVNKMDLVRYSRETFEEIRGQIRGLMKEYDFNTCEVIPTSATAGGNIVEKAAEMPWYEGEPLLTILETVDVAGQSSETGFTLPVQRVCRPDSTFRGYEGTIATGRISVGDTVRVLPSGSSSEVASILSAGSETDEAGAGEAVTLTLTGEVDISRGCVIERESGAEISSLFAARILWMNDEELVQGKSYLIHLGSAIVPGMVYELRYRIDATTGEHVPVKKLRRNEIGECRIALAEKVAYAPFGENRTLGSLILIDRITNATAGAGVIRHKLSRSDNLTWQHLDITRAVREEQMRQHAMTIWFTGLSGSGKSTIANEVEKILHASGFHTMILDGDNVRMGLNRDLGFTDQDRAENIRRVTEVARLMNDAGLIVLTSFITPFASERLRAAEAVGRENYFEVYLSTPLEECERRDVKGLYARARAGEVRNFTGISSPFEVPENPDLELNTQEISPREAAERIVEAVLKRQKK